jgi:hypothetical protein
MIDDTNKANQVLVKRVGSGHGGQNGKGEDKRTQSSGLAEAAMSLNQSSNFASLYSSSLPS